LPSPAAPTGAPCPGRHYRYTTLSIFLAGLIVCLTLVPSGILRVVFFPNVPSDSSTSPGHAPGHALADHPRLRPRIEDAAWAMNERFREQDSQGRDVIETMQVLSETDTQARVQIELLVSEERDIDSVSSASGCARHWARCAACAPSASTPRPVPAARRSTCSSGRDLEQLRQAASELKLRLARSTACAISATASTPAGGS
jgi:hypothetical protein